jgi:hypothetical protein
MDIVSLLDFNSFKVLLALTVSVIGYCIYYKKFAYYKVEMEGDYDVKKKMIGNPLPPYPNGWYIACKSEKVKKG